MRTTTYPELPIIPPQSNRAVLTSLIHISSLISTNVSVPCVTSTSFITNRRTSHRLGLAVAGGYKARIDRTPTRAYAKATFCDA